MAPAAGAAAHERAFEAGDKLGQICLTMRTGFPAPW
jgi:hypothetical protein